MIIRSVPDRSLAEFVDLEKGLVSREVYVNKDIYQQELEQIFARCWLYIGHESQVPNAGDYVLTRMGEESVIVVRDRKNQLHAFLNTCRHRGMKVCRYDEGNTLMFTCPFHAWSYDTDGRLVGVPQYDEAYHGVLQKEEWGLIEVPQFANFYGTLWATWDPKAPSFEDYLGDFEPLARQAFQGSDGSDNGVEAFGGIMKWKIPCNWKFPAFSFMGDRAHGVMTHRSTTVAAYGPQGELNGGDRHGVRNPFPFTEYDRVSTGLGHSGHVRIYHQPGVGQYVDTWQTVPGVDDYYRARWERRAKRFETQMLTSSGGCVFPNVILGGPRLLLWHPDGVGMTESWRQYFVDRDAPEVVRDAVRKYQVRYGGPGGMTESDDMENWNYASAASSGTIARRYPYNFMMALGQSHTDGPIPGTVNQPLSEEIQRGRLARWKDFMEAGSWDELYAKQAQRRQ